MLVKVANKDTESVVSALIKQSQRLPSELYRSLTWDRGKELADHQRLTLATEVEVYFCDPRSPWQRGSNENTNRLLRQYLPRGTDLSLHSQAKLSAIARQLNESLPQFPTRAEAPSSLSTASWERVPKKLNETEFSYFRTAGRWRFFATLSTFRREGDSQNGGPTGAAETPFQTSAVT